MKKIFTALLLIFTMVAFTGCGEQTAEKKDLKIATGDKSGTYYPVGSAIAEVINKDISTLNASADSTMGSIDNIKKLKDGNADLAIIQNDIAFYAVNGSEMFKDGKVENLRAIASLYPETCQFVTIADKNITSIADLKGKKVAVGAEGSGAEANARQILEAYGITYNDIEAQFLSFTDGESALRDGKVDAAFLTAGFPTKAVAETAEKMKIRILPVDNDKSAILINLYPYYTKTTIPMGTYQDQDEDVATVSVMAILAATDKINDDNGRDIAKAVFSNSETLTKAHEVGQYINIKNANAGMSIKMNAGSERYIRDYSSK